MIKNPPAVGRRRPKRWRGNRRRQRPRRPPTRAPARPSPSPAAAWAAAAAAPRAAARAARRGRRRRRTPPWQRERSARGARRLGSRELSGCLGLVLLLVDRRLGRGRLGRSRSGGSGVCRRRRPACGARRKPTERRQGSGPQRSQLLRVRGAASSRSLRSAWRPSSRACARRGCCRRARHARPTRWCSSAPSASRRGRTRRAGRALCGRPSGCPTRTTGCATTRVRARPC